MSKSITTLVEEAGGFVYGCDGFCIYWPSNEISGGLTAHDLRQLADELDRRNEQWSRTIEEYFSREL
jgi:hypothetical protein